MSAPERTPQNEVIQWIVDTRNLWPKAERTIHLNEHASRALSLLPQKEQQDVLKYVHVKDSKMALCSKLLKRYLISRYAGCSWDSANTTRNKDTKPVYVAPDGSEPLIFNVTHQAGLVVLVAAVNPMPGAQVGVDIVCPSERREKDLQSIKDEGWRRYVDIYSEVFCPREVERLYSLESEDPDHSLRYFYTLWCLREAYVKMTGEALLASWLKEVEIRDFAPPEDFDNERTSIWYDGRQLRDVDLDFVNSLNDFMICTATHRDKEGQRLKVGEYKLLDIEEAIAFGESK